MLFSSQLAAVRVQPNHKSARSPLHSIPLSGFSTGPMPLHVMLPTKPHDIQRLGVILMVRVSLLTTKLTGLRFQHPSGHPCAVGFGMLMTVGGSLRLYLILVVGIEASVLLTIPFRMSLPPFTFSRTLTILTG